MTSLTASGAKCTQEALAACLKPLEPYGLANTNPDGELIPSNYDEATWKKICRLDIIIQFVEFNIIF